MASCKPLRCILAALLVLVTASGCSSWHATPLMAPAPAPATTAGAAPAALPKKLRIHYSDGRTIVLLHPRMDGDSLRGQLEIADASRPAGTEVAFALAGVSAADARKPDTAKTVGMILLGGAIVYAVAIAIVLKEMD
jgi:hypothetical protein